MSNITSQRAGELLRSVFEILWDRSEGLSAQEVLSQIPHIAQLTDDELNLSPNAHSPRYEKVIRIAIIPIVQVGWLTKNKNGLWRITQDGYDACGKFASVRDFYQEAMRLYNERRRALPENTITLEIAQETAWGQIKKHLNNLTQNDLQTMLAELLRVMEYYPSAMTLPEKLRGKIDLIAHTDPLGTEGPRIVAQIKHKGQAVTLEGVKSFISILSPNDFGMIVSMAGFTNEALQEVSENNFQKITALDAAAFFNHWETYYNELDRGVRRFLPLKAINFLDTTE